MITFDTFSLSYYDNLIKCSLVPYKEFRHARQRMKGITLPISFLHDPLYAAIRLVALYLRDGHNLPRSNQLFSNTLRFQLYSGPRDVTNLIPVAAISRRYVIIVDILTAGVPYGNIQLSPYSTRNEVLFHWFSWQITLCI